MMIVHSLVTSYFDYCSALGKCPEGAVSTKYRGYEVPVVYQEEFKADTNSYASYFEHPVEKAKQSAF